MSRPFNPRRWTLAMLVGVSCTVSLDARDKGYLARIGPAPLRFAMAKPVHVAPPEVFVLPVEQTNVVEAPVPAVPAPPVVVDTAVPVAAPAAPAVSITPPMEQPEFVPADNLLSLTPAMLHEYFKPVPGATNQTPVTVVLPVEMNFQPPIPREAPSSRATYKSE